MAGQKMWSPEEYLYLEEKWGQIAICTIAENLGRSTQAVRIKAQKLGLGPALMGGDYISFNQLVIALTGHTSDSYQTKSWIENRGFPIHMRRVNQNSFKVVYLDEFWEWAEKNRSFIDFSKLEHLALGAEPAWVDEQRRKDYYAYSLQRKDHWTPDEDAKLIRLLEHQRYGYKELSGILRRSAGAIQRRCNDLGTKLRPVKADNHGVESAWTDAHYEMLVDGIRNGESYTAIGNRLNKSEKAVRGKVYMKYLTENADKVRVMLGAGKWGDGAPEPTVRQAMSLSHCRKDARNGIADLLALLKYRRNELGYDPYWQRFMCMNWDDFEGCSMECNSCDECADFRRIREQYCARCGRTFFEKTENRFCAQCRAARKKKAQKKYAILNRGTS